MYFNVFSFYNWYNKKLNACFENSPSYSIFRKTRNMLIFSWVTVSNVSRYCTRKSSTVLNHVCLFVRNSVLWSVLFVYVLSTIFTHETFLRRISLLQNLDKMLNCPNIYYVIICLKYSIAYRLSYRRSLRSHVPTRVFYCSPIEALCKDNIIYNEKIIIHLSINNEIFCFNILIIYEQIVCSLKYW